MRTRRSAMAVCSAMIAAALAMLALTGGAAAKLTGEFVNFQFCPTTTEGVHRCVHAVTEGGKVTIGEKEVPIKNPVVLQGGFSKPVEGFSKFFAATNGVTLEKVAQPVPGGLLGLVPPENSPPLVKALVELAVENELTGVDSTLELAGPASAIKLSEANLGEAEGIALEMPVKFRLENALLGSNCYVGSDSAPIVWRLTSGVTSPPEGAEPIEGESGEVKFLEKGQILRLLGNVLVDNTWEAPKASGCGGVLLAPLIDPVINATVGLPSAAGANAAILENTISTTLASAVNKNNEENP